ncbi:hypothetical protein TNCV_3366441 [Trichonephila clavipes]|nr:hypothetical protein TNCV_3366441 [Trichonephila clavipes]
MLTSHCSATRGLLATDHVILNHGQVTWTTPELALLHLLDPRPDAVAIYCGCTQDSSLSVTTYRSLNSCRGVISEPDLLCASETEILEGLSDQFDTYIAKYVPKYRTICAVLSARGSDTHRLPAPSTFLL